MERCDMRAVPKLIVVMTIGVFLLSASGCSKKSSKPQQVQYRLYSGVQEPNDLVQIFTIDAETDSLIDSIAYPGTFAWVAASPDGKYLAVVSGKNTKIYEPAGLSLLHEISCYFPPAFYSQKGQLFGLGESSFKFFDYSTFELIDEDPSPFDTVYPAILENLQTIPGGNLICCQVVYLDGTMDSTGFMIYDPSDRRIIKWWSTLRNAEGGNYQIVLRYHMHPDGRRLYGCCGTHLFCYDLFGDSVIFDRTVYSPFGAVRVTPNGNEVYFTDPGLPNQFYTPGKIFIYNADDGSLLDEISLLDLDTTGVYPSPLYAYQIRFHPEKPKAYITCGYMLKGPGPLLVVDTDKREIIKWIFPLMDHLPEWIDIGPKL